MDFKMTSWHKEEICDCLQDVLATKKGNRAFTCLLLHMLRHTHTHLWFDGAVDGWGASGLHAAAAEGLGAGREGGVGDTVGYFVLQRWGALSVQLRALLHLGQGHTPSSFTAQHTQPHTTESHRTGKGVGGLRFPDMHGPPPPHFHLYNPPDNLTFPPRGDLHD